MEKTKREYHKKKNIQTRQDDSNVTCFKCGKKGHKSYQCTENDLQSNQVNSLFAGATVVEIEEEIDNTFGGDAWD